jgi:hypothetical protein
MLVATISIRRRILIHSLDFDPNQVGELELHRIPDEHMAAVLLSHGVDYYKNDILWIQQKTKPVYDAQFLWSNVTRCQHIIGNLCAAYEMEDTENVTVHLVNSTTGEKISSLGTYPKEYQIDVLMPSMVTIDDDSNDISIIEYGVVILSEQ